MEKSPVFELAERIVRYTDCNLFLTGKAGTGKTTFLHHIRKTTAKKMAIVAPTGVAALNAGGVTLHSLFGLPPALFLPKTTWRPGTLPDPTGHEFLKGIKLSAEKKSILKSLELLVIDEVSMLRADTLDAMDLVLRDLRKGQRAVPFGGVQVLFIGDLHQLPPVVQEDEWALLSRYYESPFFFDALSLKAAPPLHVELTHIYRQDDSRFIGLLNAIRHNNIDEDHVALLHERYNPQYEPAEGSGVITLTTHNALAETINSSALQRLNGTPDVFEGVVEGDFNQKVLPADPALMLKKGAQVMFVKNDKGEERRFYNGKIGVVDRIDFDKNVWVRFPDGSSEVKVEKERWKSIKYKYNESEDRIDEEETGSYEQLPLRLAWAVTIHKSQGLTFDHAVVDAGKAFAAGQVYVALSRLRSLEGLVLKSRIGPQAIRTDERIARFSEMKHSARSLELALDAGQRSYASRRLLQCFEWSGWMDALGSHARSYRKRVMDDAENAANWFSEAVLQPAQAANKAARTFGAQIQIYLGAPEDSLFNLPERVQAALDYFRPRFKALLDAMDAHLKQWRIRKGAKPYLKDIEALQLECRGILALLESAPKIAEAAGDDADAPALLDEAEQIRRDALKTSAPPAPAPVAKTARGDSFRASVKMLLEGFSAEEISIARGLAASTIEGHLAQGISEGELTIDRVMPAAKLAAIEAALTSTPGDAPLSAVKEKLGEDYSWGDVRMVQAYHQAQRAAKL